MRVVFTAEINLVLDNDDSAESCRHELEQRLHEVWVGEREEGETVVVKIRSITPDQEPDPLSEGRFRGLRDAAGGVQQ